MRTLYLSLLAFAASTFSNSTMAQDRSLTIYTYESFTAEWGPGPKVKEEFEKTCACTVNFVSVADGVALLSRLKLEGEGTQADIALGLDTNISAEAEATGLFEAHLLDTQTVNVPGGYSNHVFIPYDYGHFAVVYDTQAMQTPPKSMKELIEGDPTQKIAIQDPRTSTPGLGLLLWVKSIYAEDAPQAWEKLRSRVLTVTPGWSEAYGLFTKEEVPMVLSYTTSPAYHMVAEGTERYQAAPFAEGHYIQIELAGLLRTSDNKDLARQFLQFMITPAFQNIIPTTNWMMPAAATSEPLPEAFDRLAKPEKTFLMDPQEVRANRQAWIDEWLTAMIGR